MRRARGRRGDASPRTVPAGGCWGAAWTGRAVRTAVLGKQLAHGRIGALTSVRRKAVVTEVLSCSRVPYLPPLFLEEQPCAECEAFPTLSRDPARDRQDVSEDLKATRPASLRLPGVIVGPQRAQLDMRKHGMRLCRCRAGIQTPASGRVILPLVQQSRSSGPMPQPTTPHPSCPGGPKAQSSSRPRSGAPCESPTSVPSAPQRGRAPHTSSAPLGRRPVRALGRAGFWDTRPPRVCPRRDRLTCSPAPWLG